MSLPHEYMGSLRAAHDLLLSIADGTERCIPTAVRRRALATLRHFPTSALALLDAAEAARADATMNPPASAASANVILKQATVRRIKQRKVLARFSETPADDAADDAADDFTDATWNPTRE